jgi:hypothetical protein
MAHPAPPTGLCLYSAPRTYVDEAGTGHDTLHLYATGHTTSGVAMTDWDWPGIDGPYPSGREASVEGDVERVHRLHPAAGLPLASASGGIRGERGEAEGFEGRALAPCRA